MKAVKCLLENVVIKEDMEDSADLFTEEIAVEEDTNQVDKKSTDDAVTNE